MDLKKTKGKKGCHVGCGVAGETKKLEAEEEAKRKRRRVVKQGFGTIKRGRRQGWYQAELGLPAQISGTGQNSRYRPKQSYM